MVLGHRVSDFGRVGWVMVSVSDLVFDRVLSFDMRAACTSSEKEVD